LSPDVGGVVRARALAKRLNNAPLAIVDKRRDKPGQSEVMNIIGDVKGRTCILIDDIIDSGGTLCNAAQALMDAGAASVTAYITHGVLTGAAVARVTNSALKELVITDSILATAEAGLGQDPRAHHRPLIGEAIRRIADESSVSACLIGEAMRRALRRRKLGLPPEALTFQNPLSRNRPMPWLN
jgi:ribose-phosphate pyrophosphokinase